MNASATKNIATGWLAIEFPGKPAALVIERLKAAGFVWRRPAWKATWSTGKEALLVKLAGAVEVVDIRPDNNARADRLEARATQSESRSEDAFSRAQGVLEIIPLGQPILSGHHSETAHRRALKRSDTLTRKGVAEMAVGKDLRERANRLRRRASNESQRTARRIARLEAEERGYMRLVRGESAFGWGVPAAPNDPEYVARLEHVRARLTSERALLGSYEEPK